MGAEAANHLPRQHGSRLAAFPAGRWRRFTLVDVLSPFNTSARRIAGITALSLFAISGPLIYYSSEAKQYSTDVLFTIVLLVLARRCFRGNASPRDLWLLGIVGAVSIWVSHPSIFVISGISASLILYQILQRTPERLPPLLLVISAQAASFVAFYLISLRPLAASSVLLQSWEGTFAPLPPWQNVSWFTITATGALNYPMELSPAALAAAFMLLGYGSLVVRNRLIALGFSTSLVAILVASGLRMYPINGRLLLFAVPIAYLLLAEGVRCTCELLSRVNRSVAMGVAGLAVAVLLYTPASNTADKFLHPYTHDEIKPVMSYLEQRRSPDDLIYVYWRAVPAVTYYAPFYGMTDADFTAGTEGGSNLDQHSADINHFVKLGRVWFVFIDRCGQCRLDERYYLKRLNTLGTLVDQFRSDGAAAFLYKP